MAKFGLKKNKPDSGGNLYVDLDDLRRLQYQARGFSFSPKQPVNSLLSGKYVSKLRGRGLNFEELRHYRPGDDIRSMDWKTTQRTGKPHIKVYTEERERNVFIAVDQRATMFFGSTHKMKSVIAAQLAALMAWRIVDSGDRIGALVFNNTEVDFIPPKRGKQHVANVLSAIVKKNQQLAEVKEVNVDPQNHSTSLNNMMGKLQQVCGHNALIILLSDGHGWNSVTTDYLKKIRQHNEIITGHISDPLEHNLPKMPQMVISDGIQQIQVASSNTQLHARYQQNITEQLNTYAQIAKKYRIPFLPFDTVTPVERQLRKVLGGSV